MTRAERQERDTGEATSRDLTPLLRPRGIAVVGASTRRSRGTLVLENLRRFGYRGDVIAVNPKYDRLGDVPCVPSVADLPDGVDLVVVAVAADAALSVMRQVADRRIGAAVVLSSGFGDGGVGEDLRDELQAIIGDAGTLLVGPNCYGVADFSTGVVPYSGSIVDPLEAGGTALILQSGALTHSITDSAIGRGLGLSALVTTGNEVGLTVADYVDWYVQDPATHTIGVFIEGLRDVAGFAEACRRARAANKAVVVVATGKSERSRGAALAHTGAIAGSGSAMAGLLRSVGAVQVDDLDEFRETLLLFQVRRSPESSGTALVSISGGGSGLLADLAQVVGLDLVAFDEDARERISKVLPAFGVVANPLDATGAAADDPGLLRDVLDQVAEDPAVGAVCFAFNVGAASPAQQRLYRAQAEVMARFAHESRAVTLGLSLTAGPVDPVVRDSLQSAGVPLLSGARSGLASITRWHRWHRDADLATTVTPSDRTLRVAASLAGEDAMSELAGAGIRIPRATLARTPEEAVSAAREIGFPCVLKIESPDIVHKTEFNGVRVGLSSVQEVREAAVQILRDASQRAGGARIDGVLVQEMVSEPGLECLVGVVRDPQVGPVLSLAPGGVLVEIMGESASWPLPVGSRQVEWLIDHGLLGKLLGGYRGGPRYDRDALVKTVVAFSELASSFGSTLAAAEINPLIVLPEGRGAVAVDCLVVPETRGDAGL